MASSSSTPAAAVVDDASAPSQTDEDVGICCFFLKYGVCEPPRPPCRFRHDVAADDGVTPCCFGATCRLGHKRRVLSANCKTIKDTKEYWNKYNNSDGDGLVGTSPAVRDATLLRSQLEPWSTAVLRSRLVEHFGEDHRVLDPWSRADLMNRLLEHYQAAGTRKVIRVEGVPVDDDLLAEIRQELNLWRARHGAVNTRPSISATSYMILRSPKEFGTKSSNKAQQAAKKLAQNQRLWDLAEKAIQQVGDSTFAENFSALAITYGFQGSPHIDKQNTGPFYGLSVGDFPDGQGGVCVEAEYDTVAHINTKNRLGKVDGRYPHWVAEYQEGCERYSLIYYSTWHSYQQPGKAYFSMPM